MIKFISKLKAKKSLLIPVLCFALTIAAVLSGILVPKLLLSQKVKAQMSVVETAPEDYYLASSTIMARKASEQLSSLDRIKLIAGTWESTSVKCSTNDGFLNESEAVKLAKQQLEHLYDTGVYPYSLSSSYRNWYSWSTSLYQYTDTAFSTYTAYLWIIEFTKFDNSLTHTILMTENGTILNAEVSGNTVQDSGITMPSSDTFSPDKLNCSPIIDAYSEETISNTIGENIYIHDTKRNDTLKTTPPYPHIDLSKAEYENIYNLVLSIPLKDNESYFIYAYKTDSSYGIGIVPE